MGLQRIIRWLQLRAVIYRFWETMFVFPVYSIVFSWSSSKGWDTSWHFQMQHNQADIHFLHGSPPLAQPPLSSTTVTTTTPLSQPPQLTKASFSHLPLSVPTTHSGNTWTLPCLALAAHLGSRRVRQEKPRFSASNGPASGREGLCHFLVVVSLSFGLSVGTPGWIKKKLQNNDSGKPSLLGILNAVLNKAWGCRGKRKAQTPKGIEERAVSRAPILFLLQGKTLFFPFSSMACCH